MNGWILTSRRELGSSWSLRSRSHQGSLAQVERAGSERWYSWQYPAAVSNDTKNKWSKLDQPAWLRRLRPWSHLVGKDHESVEHFGSVRLQTYLVACAVLDDLENRITWKVSKWSKQVSRVNSERFDYSSRIILVVLPSGRVGGALSVLGVMEKVVSLPLVILEHDMLAIDDHYVIADIAFDR